MKRGQDAEEGAWTKWGRQQTAGVNFTGGLGQGSGEPAGAKGHPDSHTHTAAYPSQHSILCASIHRKAKLLPFMKMQPSSTLTGNSHLAEAEGSGPGVRWWFADRRKAPCPAPPPRTSPHWIRLPGAPPDHCLPHPPHTSPHETPPGLPHLCAAEQP